MRIASIKKCALMRIGYGRGLAITGLETEIPLDQASRPAALIAIFDVNYPAFSVGNCPYVGALTPLRTSRSCRPL